LRFARLSALGLVALLAACGSSAPPGPRWSPYPTIAPRDENYHGGQNALLLKYDSNHDGTLTREELVAGLKAEFAALDAKHTGCLTPDQVDDINQARIAADQSAATPIQDWNQDGCVDFREYSAAAYSLFDKLDRNGDGKIDRQEFARVHVNDGEQQSQAGSNAAQGASSMPSRSIEERSKFSGSADKRNR